MSEVKSMLTEFFGAAVIASVVSMGIAPVDAAPLMLEFSSTNILVAHVEKVGWRRDYRRYGYPVPYAYYPPTYGYYAPPPVYAYPPQGYYPPPVGGYASAPPPEGDYSDAPDGDYADAPPPEGSYANGPDGDYGDAPAPEGY